jgi:hypothetical protein
MKWEILINVVIVVVAILCFPWRRLSNTDRDHTPEPRFPLDPPNPAGGTDGHGDPNVDGGHS